MLKLSNGNAKMKKTAKKLMKTFPTGIIRLASGHEVAVRSFRTVSFNLPAGVSDGGFVVCPLAGDCFDICYAQQGRYLFGNVKAVREENLHRVRELLKFGGVEMLATTLTALVGADGAGIVRIHDSGDFFGVPYLKAWIEVAKALPDVIFYAYTKMVPLFTRLYADGALPPNLVITFSEGGKADADIPFGHAVSRIFPTLAERVAAGFVDGNESDMPAVLGVEKVGLVYHGVSKMTPEQTARIRVSKRRFGAQAAA